MRVLGEMPERSGWAAVAGLIAALLLGPSAIAGEMDAGGDPSAAASRSAARDRELAGQVVEQVLGRMQDAVGFAAEFEQINRWAAFDEPDQARGRLTVAPPDRFRFDYSEPDGHVVGSDGEHVYTVIPEERQVLRAAVRHTTGLGELFWEGLERAADSTAWIERDEQGREFAHIALPPRPEWGLHELEVVLETTRATPAYYRYVDEEGNRVRFQFLSWEWLARVPEDLFGFPIPEGFERLDVD